MGMGQVFLQRSLGLKASDSFSQKKDKRSVELGPGFPALHMHIW